MRKPLLFFVLLGCAFQIAAKPLNVEVMLTDIKAIQPSEKRGDEVYFSITQYSNQQRPQEGRVPIFPTYWLSSYLKEVKDVSLWRAEIAEGESVQIVLSLIEHDVPPWNVDDHLGSAKLNLKNDRGQMKVEWAQPNYKDQPKTIQSPDAPIYTFVGDIAEYQVKFDLKKN